MVKERRGVDRRRVFVSVECRGTYIRCFRRWGKSRAWPPTFDISSLLINADSPHPPKKKSSGRTTRRLRPSKTIEAPFINFYFVTFSLKPPSPHSLSSLLLPSPLALPPSLLPSAVALLKTGCVGQSGQSRKPKGSLIRPETLTTPRRGEKEMVPMTYDLTKVGTRYPGTLPDRSTGIYIYLYTRTGIYIY